MITLCKTGAAAARATKKTMHFIWAGIMPFFSYYELVDLRIVKILAIQELITSQTFAENQ
jgi:hypothetical protein